MLVELITSYLLTNTEPMYLRTALCPCADMEVAIHVKKYDGPYYFETTPYVQRDIKDNVTGRAGAKVEIGVEWNDMAVGLYHHSSHNLDVNYGSAIEVDGIVMHWYLSR